MDTERIRNSVKEAVLFVVREPQFFSRTREEAADIIAERVVADLTGTVSALGRRGHADWCISLKACTGACDCDGDSEDEIIEQDRAARLAPDEERVREAAEHELYAYFGKKFSTERLSMQQLARDIASRAATRSAALDKADLAALRGLMDDTMMARGEAHQRGNRIAADTYAQRADTLKKILGEP